MRRIVWDENKDASIAGSIEYHSRKQARFSSTH
jgi:hypothetical protein